MKLLCVALGCHNDVTVRLLALAVRLDEGIVLQGVVNDAALVGIHRLEVDSPVRPLYLAGNVLCQVLESCLAALAVVLRVNLDAGVGRSLAVDGQEK